MTKEFDFSTSSNKYTVTTARHGFPRCPYCDEGSNVTLNGDEYWNYFGPPNLLVQQAFPNLTPEQRELILTGIHPECWDAFMGPEPTE